MNLDFLNEAQMIIEKFEEDYPVPTSVSDYIDDSENIMLYLAAKKYIERYR